MQKDERTEGGGQWEGGEGGGAARAGRAAKQASAVETGGARAAEGKRGEAGRAADTSVRVGAGWKRRDGDGRRAGSSKQQAAGSGEWGAGSGERGAGSRRGRAGWGGCHKLRKKKVVLLGAGVINWGAEGRGQRWWAAQGAGGGSIDGPSHTNRSRFGGKGKWAKKYPDQAGVMGRNKIYQKGLLDASCPVMRLRLLGQPGPGYRLTL
ncbi:hypothetical protein B0H14DRAFT_2588134 [Mycena olivaceomarginata]|nr:hypothetical protein B0H14DRAFT_2588134 [Mycena olivaceomarginata]